MKPKRPKPRYKPGDPVRLRCGNGKIKNGKAELAKWCEVGRIIEPHWHSGIGCWQYYIAFHGFDWPTQRMLEYYRKPYVLRYLESSLMPFKIPKGKK